MSCTVNLGTGQAPGIANQASDPLWQIFNSKQDIITGPAVPIGSPVWGAAPSGLHWIATQPGANAGGNQYADGDYFFVATFAGDEGVLKFRVKADNAVDVYLSGKLLLSWGDPTGGNTSGWQTFSPWQTVTTGFQLANTLTLKVHNNAAAPGTYMGVLLEGSFERNCGNPALVQSTFGIQGNFEVVVPHANGGIAHFYRDNDQTSMPWHGPTAVFGQPNIVGAVSLIESKYKNLEVVARIGDQLAHFYRDSTTGAWYGPSIFYIGVSGTPSLIEDSSGNFQVAAPVVGGIARFCRDNSDPHFPWYSVPGISGPTAQGVSLIQSSFGGNLEIVVRTGNQLQHFYRDSMSGSWHGPNLIASGVTGAPSFLQSRFGTPGNFEVVTPIVAGGMAHFWRDNSNPALPWHGPNLFGAGIVDGVSLIQSNYGDNLEVVATTGCNGVSHYYRGFSNWLGPNIIVP